MRKIRTGDAKDPLQQHPELAGVVFREDAAAPLTDDDWPQTLRPQFAFQEAAPENMDRTRLLEETRMSATVTTPTARTVADMLERLGDIPPQRLRMRPLPGTATEQDVISPPDGAKPTCELVDGVLVEKPMGYYESTLALVLVELLAPHIRQHDLGILVGEAGFLRLAPGLIRAPDLSFVSWSQLPGRKLPPGQILGVAPDLAVEILSPGNTEAEMQRKLGEYFAAGTRLVWILDPETRSARAFTGPEVFETVDEEGTLDGGEVLPGFSLSIAQWFELAGPRGEEE